MALDRLPIYVSLGFGYLAIALFRWHRRVSKLPPGPRKLPLFGNLFNLPTKFDTRILARMAKEQRSEILHFEALGNSIVVLNSRRVAEELLEKRSTIYSGRPQLPMIELTGWSFQFTIWPYGERWRTARRIFTKFFNQPNAYQGRVTRYVNKLLRDLLDDPDNYYSHIRHVPGSVIIDTTYGIRVASPSDSYVKLVEEAAADAIDILSSTFLVDVFPVLRHLPLWFPGAGKLNLRRAKKSRELARNIRSKPFEATVEMMQTGSYETSLVSTTLAQETETGVNQELLKSVAGAIYLAGSDTTTAGLGTLILALAMHPEAQKKAQRELDNGLHGSMPTLDNIKSFPYLTAFVFEAFSLTIGAKLGVPHATDSDDIYEGYHIPKGSSVIANIWAMLHDETEYPNPELFNPERFLTQDGQLDTNVQNPMDIGFGFGRRTCPGRQIAQAILTLTAASVAYLFDISKKVGENGDLIEPSPEYRASAVEGPTEFPCTITARSRAAIELINNMDDD